MPLSLVKQSCFCIFVKLFHHQTPKIVSKFLKKPPYRIKVNARIPGTKVAIPRYVQMHRTMSIAVLSVLLDGAARKQDEVMDWHFRPRQLINLLVKNSEELLVSTLAQYDAAGTDWLNNAANEVEKVIYAILTVAMSAEHNTEIQQSRLSSLIREIEQLAASVDTTMWDDSETAKSIAA